jgi:hypothetical protein
MSRSDEYELHNEYDDDAPQGEWLCAECGQECQAKRADCGIGQYEFWGRVETHHDWRWMSSCCGAEMVEDE